MSKKEPIRIAQIIGKWVGGGVESFIMNYYRNIDRTVIQFDFICDADSTCIPKDEIEKLGGKVIIVPPYQQPIKYHLTLKKVLKEGKYKIVHSHINTMSVFSLFAAKMAKVPIRIAHSHSTTNSKEKIKNILKMILKNFSKVFATDYFSCSEDAGRYQFGNKSYDIGDVNVINNAIDVIRFKYDEKNRTIKRKELNIQDNEIVIGHVGRFASVKNHSFLIDIFYEIIKIEQNSKLILVGQGPLEEKIKERVKELKLEKKVIFLGQREDVNEIYQAMDAFVLPSLYEGLGLVLIESQCCGIPSFCSTRVPEDVRVTNILDFIDLKTSPKIWALQIVEAINTNKRKDYTKEISANGYNIKEEVKKLEKKYIEYIKRK